MVMGVMMMMIWSIEGVMIRTNTRIWVAHGLRHNRHPTRWGHHGRHAHQTCWQYGNYVKLYNHYILKLKLHYATNPTNISYFQFPENIPLSKTLWNSKTITDHTINNIFKTFTSSNQKVTIPCMETGGGCVMETIMGGRC